MSKDISKALKKKTDAQLRLLEQDAAPIVRESNTGENFIADPNEYSQQLLAGKNITITTAGNTKTINAVMGILAGDNITISAPDEDGKVTITGTVSDGSINGKDVSISDFTGKDGYVLSYDETNDQFVLTEASGGSELIVYSDGGYDIEDFEDEIYKFGLQNNGFYRDSGGYNSSYCIKSGYNGDNSKNITIQTTLNSDGLLSFYYMANVIYNNSPASELFVLVNGVKKFTRNADLSTWTKIDIPLSAGFNEIVFGKRSNSASYPCDFIIDNIALPSSGVYGMDAVLNNPDSLLLTSNNGTIIGFKPMSEIMEKSQGDILPTASEDLRGQIFTLQGGAGVADTSYICQKDASDAYVWQQI